MSNWVITRQYRNLTQEQWRELVGVNNAHFSKIENSTTDAIGTLLKDVKVQNGLMNDFFIIEKNPHFSNLKFKDV